MSSPRPPINTSSPGPPESPGVSLMISSDVDGLAPASPARRTSSALPRRALDGDEPVVLARLAGAIVSPESAEPHGDRGGATRVVDHVDARAAVDDVAVSVAGRVVVRERSSPPPPSSRSAPVSPTIQSSPPPPINRSSPGPPLSVASRLRYRVTGDLDAVVAIARSNAHFAVRPAAHGIRIHGRAPCAGVKRGARIRDLGREPRHGHADPIQLPGLCGHVHSAIALPVALVDVHRRRCGARRHGHQEQREREHNAAHAN